MKFPSTSSSREDMRWVPPLWVALGMAILAGWLMQLGFPDRDWWPLTIVGTALMMASVRGLGFSKALVVGIAGGFTFYGILIWWLTVYLGLVPWIALTLAQVVFFCLGLALIALVWRYSSRQWPGVAGRLGITPVLVGGAWLIREAIASVFPFGGFAWGRISQSQSESPLASLVSWVGTSGMSFLLAWAAALMVALLYETRMGLDGRAALAAATWVALMVWPTFPVQNSGTLRVLAVQGNADAGLFAQYERGDNLKDHYRVTRELFDQETNVDVIIWPENASDIDPLRYPEAAAVVSEVVRELGAPLVVGTITKSGEETFNSMLLWDMDKDIGRSVVRDQYDKIHPVPFAEYLPARDFFYPLAPSLFDMIPRDYSFGKRDTIFEVAGATAGIAICYDIVDDEILWTMMRGGADIIFAPTNNADFGQTNQSLQQLAIARMRAIETGRTVINISTVGTSAVIDPTGSELDRLPTYTEGYMLLDVPLANHTTPATMLERSLELFLVGLTLAGLAVSAVGHRRRTTRRKN
jgi:apolipoprotein N-acyltransferase